MVIRLRGADARMLEGYCRRQLRWDPVLTARVVTASHAVGVFTAPPMGVLAFAAVPTVDPVEPGDAADATVPLAQLADALRDRGESGMRFSDVPRALVPVGRAPSLSHLPPTEGWQQATFAVAGDVVPSVDEATAEFESRSAGLRPREQEVVAEEIWDRPGFAGLPMRVLHAAHRLGMIGNDRTRICAATCGPWRRLSTPHGQVFAYLGGPATRLTVRPVR